MYTPPFDLTPKILSISLNIQELLGELKDTTLVKPSVLLRKKNKIKTIHSSLAIEGNDLSEAQITALIDKKRVAGSQKQIKEVQNALKLYDDLHLFNAFNEKDLLKSHAILMDGLVDAPGKYRSSNVGIFKGSKVGHVAPQAKLVPALMKDLFVFLTTKDGIPFLIKACIFHYELEFIHPFEDGNGRMGRLWQQLLLMKHSPLFEYLSVESLIHKEQKKYYRVLEACDKAGDSNAFIEFSLELIFLVLKEFKDEFRPPKMSGFDRVKMALEAFNDNSFSRKEYMALYKDISTATASRDLSSAVEEGVLKLFGDKALAKYVISKKK